MTEQREVTLAQKRNWLVVNNGPIQKELREIGTGPMYVFAERVEAFAKQFPDLVRQYGQWHAVDRVKYAESTLPPDLREPFSSQGHDVPPIPETEAGLESFMREYWPYRVQRAPVLSPGYTTGEPEDRKDLKEELRRRIHEGQTIDPDAWQEYETVHHTQQERAKAGRGICLLHDFAAQATKQDNIAFTNDRGLFDQATGRYDSFLMSPNSSPYHSVTPLIAPIGEYGEEFALRLLRTWSFLVDFAGQDNVTLAAWSKQIEPEHHRQTAERHFLRSIDRDFPGAEEGAIAGQQEGLGSMMSMIFLHTALKKKHLGDNHNDAFNRVCNDDLINGTTGHASLAFAFPLMLHGLYFEDSSKLTNGRLTESDDLKNRMSIMQANSEELAYQEWKEHHKKLKRGDKNAVPPTRLGDRCPFFGEFRNEDQVLTPGAISRLTKTIQTVYNIMSPLSDASLGMGLPWDIPRFVEPIEQPPRPTIGGRLMALADAGTIFLKDMSIEGQCC